MGACAAVLWPCAIAGECGTEVQGEMRQRPPQQNDNQNRPQAHWGTEEKAVWRGQPEKTSFLQPRSFLQPGRLRSLASAGCL